MNLAENIRTLRRNPGMTQEQLAEAMGVTVGAVSKWETGASIPDVTLLMAMAELFQTSLDALLGFVLKSGSREEWVQTIGDCIGTRAYGEGRVKAEKALLAFPNHFDIVYKFAKFNEILGLERQEDEAVRRAIALYGRAAGLPNQNQDRQISARIIQASIYHCYSYLNEYDRPLDILRKANEGGVYDDLIGTALMNMERYEEAMQVLSESFLDCTTKIFRIVTGMVNCLGNGTASNHKAALEPEDWLVSFEESLYTENPCYLNKSFTALLTCCASIAAEAEDEEACLHYFKRAKEAAERFDAAPCYEMSKMRFYWGRPPQRTMTLVTQPWKVFCALLTGRMQKHKLRSKSYGNV